MASSSKAHAVFIPLPFQSHIKCMLKLAKLFHSRGVHITFVNTHHNHKRILKSKGPNSLDGSPDFQFKSISDGLPPSDDDQQDPDALGDSLRNNNCLDPFIDLVKELMMNGNDPPVTMILADGFMSFTLKAAQQLGIPLLFFFTIAASSFMLLNQFRALVDKGIAPPRDEDYLTNGYLDSIIDWVPGMKDIRFRDLPSFVRSKDPKVHEFLIEVTEIASKSSGIILHTFDALEQDIVDALISFLPRLYAIGPQQMLLSNIKEDPLKSIGDNLWREDTDCLSWLDTKQHDSVIYISFGSSTTMTNEKLIEFGMGIADSKHSFLWIIRPDLVVGESAVLPPEFMAAAKERGLVLSWCPQEEVLNHPSVGGFLTHCGWGSVIESLSAGVPMLCWPFFGDQMTNCRFACVEWGVGIEMENNVKRDEVEKLVKELMEGEKGKKMKKKAMEWKALASEATSPFGSSSINLDKIVNL